MEKSKIIFLSVLLFSFTIFAQKRISIEGHINDKIGKVTDVHIINKNTTRGTISNTEGIFSIVVKENDSLKISSIQHYTRKIKVTKEHIQTQRINITLKLKNYVLEEVEIENRDLFEIYKSTINTTLEDIAIVKARGALDFSNVKVEANKDYNKSDEIHEKLNNVVDPTKQFEGLNLFKLFTPFKSILKNNKVKKELTFKERFPKLLKSKLGEDFFHKKLKIPQNKYHHFLLYCEPLNIQKLFKEDRILELIQLFLDEEEKYLKTLKNTEK
ncbi:carboxypeptidase-like regulatory domain-containing protein [Tenacibaculum agarivorans]|uniref:carboxypeptidase-like regulatory domain-containing protein n=1 Tax=Tenacibaculum agarivorans TaxID=1908389 RepID=UPI00094BC148|nr:carboxypeptidase-like regulatory domain-containing protein [Tenacibaculum agarivorans]